MISGCAGLGQQTTAYALGDGKQVLSVIAEATTVPDTAWAFSYRRGFGSHIDAGGRIGPTFASIDGKFVLVQGDVGAIAVVPRIAVALLGPHWWTHVPVLGTWRVTERVGLTFGAGASTAVGVPRIGGGTVSGNFVSGSVGAYFRLGESWALSPEVTLLAPVTGTAAMRDYFLAALGLGLSWGDTAIGPKSAGVR